jgi:hypothetical protein
VNWRKKGVVLPDTRHYGPEQETWHHWDTKGERHILADVEALGKAELAELEKRMSMLQNALAAEKTLFAWKDKLCISSEDWSKLMSFIQTLEARKSILEECKDVRSIPTTYNMDKAKEELRSVAPMLAEFVKVVRGGRD